MAKADNQYYGRAFEEAICCILNNEEGNFDYYNFSSDELENIMDCAAIASKYFKKGKAIHNGRKVMDTGDIIIDGETYEIKFVSAGSGTYLNTSMRLLDSFLPFTYLPYMEVVGIFDCYKRNNIKYSYDISPIKSTIEASNLRKQNVAFTKEIGELDKIARANYVRDVYNYFCSHRKQLAQFLTTLITKDNYAEKQIPDHYIVYNYKNNSIINLNRNDILHSIDISDFKNSGLSLVFKNIRIAIGYQNGNGICNPTLRVFLRD